jgi:hypothetical protein
MPRRLYQVQPGPSQTIVLSRSAGFSARKIDKTNKTLNKGKNDNMLHIIIIPGKTSDCEPFDKILNNGKNY